MNEDNNDGVAVPQQVEEVNINIQNLIRERKAERRLVAEQKRQLDMQRIRDTRSAAGISPLKLFPKEIWLVILTELDPEDREKLWKLHLVFRDLMETTRVRDNLLPLVMKVDVFESCVGKSFGSKFNEELRLISKSSRKSFDHIMDSKILKEVREREATSAFVYGGSKLTKYFCLNGNIEREIASFLSNFNDETNPAKRFFLRGLFIEFTETWLDDIDDPERIKEFRDAYAKKLTTLLEVLGDQIWRFRFYLCKLYTAPFSISELYILFQRWMTLMPNLKWLEISIDDGEDTIKADEDLLQDIARRYPYPRLESLERLSLHFSFNQKGVKIFEALIEANQHVQIIDFYGKVAAKLDLLPAHLIGSLPLNKISIQNTLHLGVSLDCIRPIINFNWQLKSILLELHVSNTNLASVFRFLERFPTLETVALFNLRRLGIENDETFGYLELPNLTSFTMEISNNPMTFEDYKDNPNVNHFFSLQFLLHCKNLKLLSWSLSGINDMELRRQLKKFEKNGTNLDFRAGLRFVYESKIWDVFPILDSVTVKVVNIKRSPPVGDRCTQTYRREAIGDKMLVTKFLESHDCSRLGRLKKCVVLVG